MNFKTKTLHNGLTIIGEQMSSAKSMALGYFIRTGSRDEHANVSGVSHFLEHMIFKGTPNRSAIDVNLEFDRMGAKYNAFTSEETTVYYSAVLPEYQSDSLKLWADLMRPSLRDEDFNTEKGVICEEIAMYKDLPHFDVMDRCRHLHFGDHGCGNSVLGTVESIQNMTRSAMTEYFNTRYSPDNMVLGCTGNIDWPMIIAETEELCSDWPARQPKRSLSDFRGTGKTQIIQSDTIQRQHLCMMSAGPSAQDTARYAAILLANIIGDDTGSKFYWALVDTALADCAEMDYDSSDGTGAFYIYISCDPKQAAKVIETVRSILTSLKNVGITEEELQASKNKIASQITLSSELPMGRLVPLGYNWLYRRQYSSLSEELEKIIAITPRDLDELIQEFPFDNMTIQGLGPNKSL